MWNIADKIAKQLQKNAILFYNKIFYNDISVLNDIKRSFHVWWKRFRRACAWQEFLAHVDTFSAEGRTSSPSNLTDFIAGKTTSIVPAISYDSNFVFPLAGNARSTLKNIGAVRKPQETNRARYAPVNLYANFTELPLRRMALGKLWEPSFHRKSYDFRPISWRTDRRYSSMFFSRHEFRSFYHRLGAYDKKSKNNF